MEKEQPKTIIFHSPFAGVRTAAMIKQLDAGNVAWVRAELLSLIPEEERDA